MNSHQGLFISGLVLGLGSGLILGHFLHPAAGVESSTAPRFVFNDAPLSTRFLPSPGGAIAPGSLSDDVELDDALEGLLPSSSPLQNALAFETSREETHQSTGQFVPVPPDSPQSEPEPLTVKKAAPLATNSAQDQQTIRGIIDIELSHLPEEKRQVWFDALKDVNKEDVAGILRMWKLLGGPIPETPVGLPGFPPVSSTGPGSFPVFDKTIAPPAEQKPASTLQKLLDQADEIVRHNRLMELTPGSIPRVPSFTQSASGEWNLTVSEDFTAVRPVATGFPLDLAIRGNGFFMVVTEDGTRTFTRRGNFTLDKQRRLALPDGDRLLVLQPEIVIPEVDDSAWPQINEHGEVSLVMTKTNAEGAVPPPRKLGQIQLARIWQGQDLQRVGNGLYQLPKEKQQHWTPMSPEIHETRVHVGMIELPVAKVELHETLQRLRRSLSR